MFGYHKLAVVAPAMVVAALLSATSASAGECPAGKLGDNMAAKSNNGPKDVTDTVLATIDVAKEPAAIDGRSFRLRRLVVQPGGVVPWHSHSERPAIIHVVSGEITEHSSSCLVPIVHRAGETTAERNPTSHWWMNTGKAPAVLLSADLLPVSADGKVM